MLVGSSDVLWRFWERSWLYMHSWVIGATTFALAGVFQFTPLKSRCLKQCRSPFGFFVRYYLQGVGAA